ncbi:MAG: hypothetical protein K2H53_00535 [Clostridia bacterium]|nr:hypothetical protein [Clostridia bacterium]
MENKKEEQDFKAGLKVDINTQTKQMDEYLLKSLNERSNVLENKDLCKNFFAGLALEINRMFSDLNMAYKFRFKGPESSEKKLKEIIYTVNKKKEIDLNIVSTDNGDLKFSKGLYDTCAFRMILMNVPPLESLQNNVYLSYEQKQEIEESYALYASYRRRYFELQEELQVLLRTKSEQDYYDLHIAVYTQIAEMEKELRMILNMPDEMTGDEEKYRNKARILQIDLEDGKVLTQVSDAEIASLEDDMALLSRKLPDITQQKILNIVYSTVMSKSELLSERFGATISDNDARTKEKIKKNGYISYFKGMDIPNGDTSIKIEGQLQPYYRYLRHKETHSEMDGKLMELPEVPKKGKPGSKKKIEGYKEYLDRILYEGYDLRFSVEIPDEIEISPHTIEASLENLYIPFKDSKNVIVRKQFREKISALREAGILGENNREIETYSLKSINEFLDEREKQQVNKGEDRNK